MEKSDSLLNSPLVRDRSRSNYHDETTHFLQGEQEKNEIDIEEHAQYTPEDPSRPSIFHLPLEMIDTIFSFLDGETLITTSRVCRVFKKLSEENVYWYNHCAAAKRHIFWLANQDHTRLLKYNWKDVWLWYQRVDSRRFTTDDKKSGCGTDVTDQGCYRGEFKENKKEGKGVHVWTDHSRYEGEWKNDKRNGFGTYFWADGRRFEGEHKNDKRSHGTFYWPEGSVYTGDYSESHRDGKGKFTWPDGDSFEGEWRKGGRFGKGIFTSVQKDDEGVYIQENWAEENFEFAEKGPRIKREELEIKTRKRDMSSEDRPKKKKKSRK